MLSEIVRSLSDWGPLDTWIAVTAILAAAACAIPGVFLVLRRQSMMGDALSHAVLPGIVIAFLAVHRLVESGLVSPGAYPALRHAVVFSGAVVLGIAAAVLTEWVAKFGRVEESAALGVVFITLFAVGLLLIRLVADEVDLDPDCVLYGTIETVVLDTHQATGIPRAALVNGAMLLVNLVLVVVFFKELRVAAFDPALATTLGINARVMHYGLMAVTAATLVAAFESVGSILVIAMLIVPPATASLLAHRMGSLLVWSILVAAASAVMGHAMAISLPPAIFGPLGFPAVLDASTAGMMALASGILFVTAMLFAPGAGILSQLVGRSRLRLKIAGEDMLGLLLRVEEHRRDGRPAIAEKMLAEIASQEPIVSRLAIVQLRREGKIAATDTGYRLTDHGRTAAEQLIRSHRLWESYMAKHFTVADDHLHETAARVEHYIDPELREEIAADLKRPQRDPHGREIPPEKPASDWKAESRKRKAD
jgi:manganese/zinc/iron transport system permease protein